MTRITLDLAKLVSEGELTEQEAERLKGLAVTGKAVSVIVNLLCIFGALALAAGVVALKPDPSTGLFLAIIALGIAGFIRFNAFEEWKVLGDGMAIAGTFGLCGWFGLEFGDGLNGMVTNTILTLITLASTIIFRNAFLAAFIPLGIGAILGSGTAYWHASYGLFVREATVTVVVFTIIAVLLYMLLERIRKSGYSLWETVVLIPARVSFFMINFGFWVGSLWGDWVGEYFRFAETYDYEKRNAWRETAFHINEAWFSLGWAAFLGVAIVWGLKKHNRFVTNTAIVFLAIHFYTQFHEFFGFNPGTLVMGGIFLLACSVGLYRFDRMQTAKTKNLLS